ncbi:metallophosphoesterase [bacterium]|nr:metallophosphoesterase [bacterium]
MTNKTNKALIVADLHLSHKHRFPNPQMRLRRDIQAVNNLCREVVRLNCNSLIIAGDFFDTYNPSIELLNSIIGEMQTLATDNDVRIYFIRGNGIHEGAKDRWSNPLLTLASAIDNALFIDCGYHIEPSIDDIIMIPHCESSDEFLSNLDSAIINRNASDKYSNHKDQCYIICHQWFDTLFRFDSPDTIRCDDILKITNKREDVKFRFISGHQHKSVSVYYNDNISIASIGIPIQQNFGDPLDTNAILLESFTGKLDYHWNKIELSDIKFKKIKASNMEEFERFTDPDAKKHLYSIDIQCEEDEKLFKAMSEEGYFIEPNFMKPENVPGKIEREEIKLDSDIESILSETVDELSGEPEEVRKEIIAIGMELTKEPCPF